jgi:hypothetical protein
MAITVRRVRRVLRRRILGWPGKRLEHADLTGWSVAPRFAPEALLRWTNAPAPLHRTELVPTASVAEPGGIVLGIELGGDERAYPVTALGWRHVLNDVVGGAPVVVTFCPRCRSGAAFDPRVAGRDLTFHLYGGYQGTVVMQDDQTGTLWSHVTGESLAGPLVSHSMEQLPVELVPLEQWIARHPRSLAPLAARRPHRAHRPQDSPDWVGRTIHAPDDRLAPRTRVLGVSEGTAARAYVLDTASPPPLLGQDHLGDVPIALLGSPGSWPLAFDRRLDGVVLEFALDGARAVDMGGSTWSASGTATGGPSTGRRLSFVPSLVTNWHAWSGYHPGCDIAHLADVTGR